ncbi:MAG TPA: hypothetical protein VF676_04400 [Flavobacterium sp.]|jgi:hypothetical protein
MRKQFLGVVAICAIAMASCSSDDNGTSSAGAVDHSKLTGWWYPNEENGIDYRGRFFGEDGEYKQDQTNYNLGMGIGTYEWVPEGDTLAITPVSGFFGGLFKLPVHKLTPDSLVISYQGDFYRYSRTEPTN